MNWEKFFEITRLKFLWTIRKEAVLAILGVIAFVWIIKLFRAVDSTAGVLDVAMLHFLVLAALAVALGLVAAFTALHVAWRDMDRYIDGDDPNFSLKKDWQECPPTVRIAVTIGMFVTIFLGFVVAFAASVA
jgi:hypothetical protein